MNQATQTGAVQQQHPDVKPDEVSVNVNKSPRDVALEGIENRQDEARIAQIAADIEGDPGAAAIAKRMQDAQDAAHKTAVDLGQLPPDDADGAATRQPMHPDEPAALAALPEPVAAVPGVPANLQSDPLAEHIVMDGEQPMFTLVINGENVLMPLSEARRKLQIGTAAEIRMQTAAAREKDVIAREQRLSTGERALAARVGTPEIQPVPIQAAPVQTAPVQMGLSEEAIRLRSRNIMKTAFSGTEEDAGDMLSSLLLEVQTPQAMPAAPIDEAALTHRVAKATISAVTAVNTERDLVTGLKTFKDEYPGIMNDVNLYNMADGMTDGIQAENPTWSKSEVMLEAGKRTSEWVENLKGTPVVEDIPEPVVTPNETISAPALPPQTQIRQERKRELVQIPQAASAAQPAPEPEVQEQTPTEALDEVRLSRGQAV